MPTTRARSRSFASLTRHFTQLGALALMFIGPLLGVPGCKRSDKAATPGAAGPAAPVVRPTPILGEVSVVDLTPEEERPGGQPLAVAPLVDEIKRTLGEAKLFAAAPATPAGQDAPPVPAARVRVQFGGENVVAGEKAAARATVHLRIDTRPSEIADGHWNEDVQAGAETQYQVASKPDQRELMQRLVTRTLNDLLAAYIARQRLWTGNEAAARAAIKADAGELRLEALRVVGERRLSGAVPELLALLEDEDEAVRDAALGALVELRERKAVGVLASQKSMRDKREMRKILDAISALGGDEAAEYLSFVADGHDDPEIRTMAAQAKARLVRKAAEAK